MKIIIDCMSGDNAPEEIVKGAVAGLPGTRCTAGSRRQKKML